MKVRAMTCSLMDLSAVLKNKISINNNEDKKNCAIQAC